MRRLRLRAKSTLKPSMRSHCSHHSQSMPWVAWASTKGERWPVISLSSSATPVSVSRGMTTFPGQRPHRRSRLSMCALRWLPQPVGRTRALLTALPSYHPFWKQLCHRRELSPTQVSALSSLLDQLSVDLIVRIVEEASGQRSGLDLKALTEELAREELLRFGRGTRQQVSEKLSSLLTKSGPGFWLDRLVQATRFHQIERPGRTSSPSEEKQSSHRDEAKAEQPDPLDSIDWGYIASSPQKKLPM